MMIQAYGGCCVSTAPEVNNVEPQACTYPRSNEDAIVPPQTLSLQHAAIDAHTQENGGEECQRPDAGEELRGLVVVRKGSQLLGC